MNNNNNEKEDKAEAAVSSTHDPGTIFSSVLGIFQLNYPCI